MSELINTLVGQLARKERIITIDTVLKSFEKLLEDAYAAEPRLHAFVDGYQWSAQRTGLKKNFKVEVSYRDTAPEDINQVLDARQSFNLMAYIKAKGSLPDLVQAITFDAGRFINQLNEDMAGVTTLYPELLDVQYLYYTHHDPHLVLIQFLTGIPGQQRARMQDTAGKRAKSLVAGMFGSGATPDMVKVFLVFSLIKQRCRFDQATENLLVKKELASIAQPSFLCAYGPLVEGRGTSLGMALAVKELLDACGIGCRVIRGYVGSRFDNLHWWNLVSLDGSTYHLDASWGHSVKGVHIGRFLKPDDAMYDAYAWEYDALPSSSNTDYDYNRIEAWINGNGRELLDDGVSDDLLWPDIIE